MIEKKITVENLVEKFSLKVLAGEGQLQKTITQPRVHRPGLEFVGYFDFFPTERVQILGKKEINYLHKLTEEERKIRIEREPEYIEYLGIKIPSIEIQLQPGRDVAGLIEAAANNWYLRQQGYSAAEEFYSRLEGK